MQTIFRTTPAANFTLVANDLITSQIPPIPKAILLYLLSKPPFWHLKPHDLRKQLGLSAYAVKKALRWLCSAGYAAYFRLKTGHTVWKIFSEPTAPETAASPTITPQVEIPRVENQPVLEKNKPQKEILKPQQPTPPTQDRVVVVSDELIFPEQLKPEQLKPVKAIIKKIKEPTLQQPVLFALAWAITNGKIKSSLPGYLNSLVTAANNGTFTPIETLSAPKANKPIIPIFTGHKPPEKIDNVKFAKDLINQYGNRARACIVGINF